MGKILAQEPDAVAIPRRTLLSIVALVVVAHLLALQGASSALQASQRLLGKSFVMRNVTITAPNSPPALVPPPEKIVLASPRLAKPPPLIPAQAEPLPLPLTAPSSNVEQAVATDTKPAVPVETVSAAPAPMPTVANGADQAKGAPPEPADANALAGAKVAVNPEVEIEFLAPGSARLKYDVIANKDNLSYSARAELLWLREGKNYEARLEVSAFLLGARVRTSTGSLTPEGLEPSRFSDRFRTELAAHFVRDRKIVLFSANTPDTDLVPGMQDQLSVFVQIGGMLAAAPKKYPPGTTLTFETIGPRAAETWVLSVEMEETLKLPGGSVKAIKLIRAPRLQYDQTAELWLAPEEGYLPVRIKITERNGDFVDQLWRSTEAP